MSLADPAFYPEVVNDVVRDMIETEYIQNLTLFHTDDRVLSPERYGGHKWDSSSLPPADRRATGFNYLEDHGTSHLSVVDPELNAVAITTTVNTEFGSGFLSPSTGILLNNQMDDFASQGRPNYFGLPPSPLNYPEPKKRPLSSMSPTLIFHEDKLRMVVGASGGPKIITSTLQTVLNHMLAGLDLFEANTAPRIHDQILYHNEPTCVYSAETMLNGAEITLDEITMDSMAKRGE